MEVIYMKYEFGSLSTTREGINFYEHFELFYDNDYEQFYLSKREFTHEEEDFNFNYKYAISVKDLAEYTGEPSPISIELAIVVSPDSLCDKTRDSIADSSDWSSEDLDSDWKYYDIYSYMPITMDTVELPNDSGKAIEDIEELTYLLDSIGAVYECVDSLRGFYLDRPWNRIGSTGWDLLKEFVLGESFIKTTIGRYK